MINSPDQHQFKEQTTFQEILEKNNINYLHGSNSGSLPGIFLLKQPGLKPLGELLKNKITPYSGELMHGAIDINQHSISCVPNNSPKEALRYSDNCTPWTPAEGRDKINFLTQYLLAVRKGREEEKKFREKEKFGTTLSYNQLLRLLPMQLKIEKRRLKDWDKQTPVEQEFISSPFPVLYGISYDGHSVPVNSGISTEVALPGIVPTDQLTLFVPKDKISAVNDYIASKNLKVRDILDIAMYNKSNRQFNF
jgi:hypothetical protein